MAQGNRGFADLVANAGQGRGVTPRPPPRSGILGARENRLAELASGGMLTRVHEFVDPARCRIWEGHNRNYAALNETVCADLIESIRAQGRQEVPAIVRRVSGVPEYDYEVICGARRHWTISWLRAHAYPEFRFLVEPRELTDEEAFRLADLENRSRKDLSDYERATDYARAIERYYGGSQQRMVERLEVSKSWLSRYLELARLPPVVLACFSAPEVIGITHAAALAPLLRAPKSRAKLLEAAETLAQETPRPPPGVVVRRLQQAAAARPARAGGKEIVVKDADGVVLVKAARGLGGAISMTIPRAAARDRAAVVAALAACLEQLLESK